MKKINKKQKVEKILNLIKKMEKNTFLMPDSCSELYSMATVGSRGDCDRYINIEYTNNDEICNPKEEDCFKIEIRKNAVYLQKRLGDSRSEDDLVLDILVVRDYDNA